MYTYLELDNLEYAVEKYKLGYMSARQALRCLKTFQVRCKSPDFLELAQHCATINEGYTSDIIEVVKRIYNQQVTSVRNTESLQDSEENSGR